MVTGPGRGPARWRLRGAHGGAGSAAPEGARTAHVSEDMSRHVRSLPGRALRKFHGVRRLQRLRASPDADCILVDSKVSHAPPVFCYQMPC